MARILAIDFGTKRSGIAVTDQLQIIVSGLDTVDTPTLKNYIIDYCKLEEVEKIVIGRPTHRDGTETKLFKTINELVEQLKKKLPSIKFDFEDESFTSQEAKQIILRSGYSKKKRRNKGLVDRVSAVLILQNYLGHI